MPHNPTTLHHRMIEIRQFRLANRVAVSGGFRIPLTRFPPAAGGRLYRPVLLRAGGTVLVSAPFCLAENTFIRVSTIEQSFATLIVALLVGIMQTLIDPFVAAHTDKVVPAKRAVSPEHDVQPSMVEPVARLQPAPAPDKAFDDAVRRALTHLCDPTKLSLSPLLRMSLVTVALQKQGHEDTRLQRVALLKILLTDLVHGLRPQQRSDGCTSAANRFYNCLYYPYVQGITRRAAPTVLRQLRERRDQEGGARTEEERVIEWLLQVNEDTYYKWQRRASDTIAHALREKEEALDDNMPAFRGLAVSA